MKILLLATVVLAVCHLGHAAHKRSVTKRMARGQGIASLARQMNLGERCSFRQGAKARTAKGYRRQRLRQMFSGMEVVGATADVEVTREGVMTGSVSGSLAFSLDSDIPDSDACQRTRDELMDAARDYLETRHHLTIPQDTPVEQLSVKRKVYFEGSDGVAKIVYQVQFFVGLAPTPCRPFFLFDACDPGLDVVVYFDKIHNMTLAMRQRRQEEECDTTTAGPTPSPNPPTGACPNTAPAQGEGGNPKTGRIVYGQNRPFCLYTEVAGSTCTMESKYAKVIDLENGRSDRGKTPVEFTCSQGYSDPINGAYGVANDAFYYGDATGQLYQQWYGFYALGYAPKLKVHYSECYENAFWDGTDMTFGDGCNYLYPLVSQDVIAHELGHGITDRYSDLYYSGQSGGINEAFSDMSGEVAELFSTDTNDWLVGRELFKGNSALRYFETPSRDGRSIDSANDFTSGMDVHYSSGVFNRAYWQLVNVQGLPIRQAYEIFLQANRVIWQETTDFDEGACGAMKAANDLGYDVNKVKNAFAVVDINLDSCNYRDIELSFAPGESRDEVIVSSIRNPVFALELPSSGASAVIDAVSENNVQVTISVTSDAAGANVISSGTAPFMFDITPETAYFKVSCAQENDAFVELTLEVVS